MKTLEQKSITYKRTSTVIILLLLTLVMPLFSIAQNNPYKIDDRCFDLFSRIYKNLRNPKAEAMADSLQLRARQKGDVKAMGVYYNVLMRVYIAKGNEAGMKRVAKECEACLKTPYTQYYWNTMSSYSRYFITTNRADEGIAILNDLMKKAESLNDNKGRSDLYMLMTEYYNNQQEYAKALEYGLKAIKAIRASGDLANIAEYEHKVGIAMSNLDMFERSDSITREALKHVPDIRRYPIVLRLANINIVNRKLSDAEMEAYFQDVNRSKKCYNGKSESVGSNAYRFYYNYYLQHKNFAQARLYLDSLTQYAKKEGDINWMSLTSKYFEETNALDSALFYYAMFYKASRELWQKGNTNILLKMDAENGKYALENQNKQLLINQLQGKQQLLEMQTAQNMLQIRNGDLELKQRDALLLARSREAQLHLANANKEKEKARFQQERSELQLAKAEALRHRSQAVLITLVVVLACAAIVIIILQVSRRRLKKKQLEAEEARARAENADRLKTLFLQNMSHEIRTPLNAIVGFNEVLNGEAADYLSAEEKHEFTSIISTNATLLTTLVNDILDLSKLESGTYNVVLSEVGAQALCDNALSSVRGREQAGVTMQIAPCAPCDAPLMLTTDAVRVQQVLINYLTNACKNTTEGSITLTYATYSHPEKGTCVRFSVTDTGCGVPPEKADTIFERFEKLDDFKQGTGLGLNICTRIADLLNGRVYLDKHYTHGARFVLDIPVQTPTPTKKS